MAGRGGAITAIQRCGSALNTNVHFHTLVAEGVFATAPDGAVRVPARRAGRMPDRRGGAPARLISRRRSPRFAAWLPARESMDGVDVVRVPVALKASKGVIMPLLMPQFEAALFAGIGRLSGRGVVLWWMPRSCASPTSQSATPCAEDASSADTMSCRASYRFPAPAGCHGAGSSRRAGGTSG
ncbi:MAG: transposase, partial [Phycisphaerales bacterium]